MLDYIAIIWIINKVQELKTSRWLPLFLLLVHRLHHDVDRFFNGLPVSHPVSPCIMPTAARLSGQ